MLMCHPAGASRPLPAGAAMYSVLACSVMRLAPGVSGTCCHMLCMLEWAMLESWDQACSEHREHVCQGLHVVMLTGNTARSRLVIYTVCKYYDCGHASELHLTLRLIHGGMLHIGQLCDDLTPGCCAHLEVPESTALQANMHALASELERVKTELNDRTAMMGAEMERWRQQADATSTQVLLHHARVIHCCAGVHAMRQHASSGMAL